MNGFYTIAIDGPSGAGKSSLARRLAGMFQFIYVDTGASKLSRYDLSGCTIAVKSTILDLDRDEDDVIEVSYDIEFVTLDELKEMDEIFNSTEENRDWYFSDFTYAEDDLFYVELYRITEVCQEKLPEEASH